MTTISEKPPWIWPRAAYIHIPFCAHHCGYCDFAVTVGRDDFRDQYIDALLTEISGLEQPQEIQTLFVGGGTPTHLSATQLDRLFRALFSWLPLTKEYEFSVEANPATLSDEKIAVLSQWGVNRVSLGAQSFRNETLHFLERDHRAAEIETVVESIRKRIGSFSLDLIFGVPGQSADDWHKDLQQALSLGPDHISTYGLTYEKGTKLWKHVRSGHVLPLSENEELQMYLQAMDVLQSAGMEHYEISNFARPTKRSQHNQEYWANHAYFGFGMGAARYVNGNRELNTRDFATYLKRISAGTSPTIQSERLSPEDTARETISLNLRRTEGIQPESFQRQTGFSIFALAESTIKKLEQSGHLLVDEVGIRLTREGKCLADSVIAQFWLGPE